MEERGDRRGAQLDGDPVRRDEPLDALLVSLSTSRAGLTSAEAARRLARDGPNLPAAASLRPRLLSLLRGALNPLVVILLIASGVSAFLGEPVNAGIIAAIVLVSTALGSLQTVRSERAVRRLRALVAPTATVLRDGAARELPRASVVIGDLVRLSAGDLVPADVRLLESRDLHVQQAALTGEAFPVEKAATDGVLAATGPDSPALAYLGTSVVSGSATAVVFATGAATAFGDIVARLAASPEETEFERGSRELGGLILKAVLFLVLFLLVVSLSLHRDPLQSLLFAVALAVGLTPEFLPMITTVTLAQGAARMAREKVIVKHLSAIQNLGSIDALCSDKTGTITAGTLALHASLAPSGAPDPRPLFLGHLNSFFETGIKSPLDVAILTEAVAGTEGFVKTDELPFDFERRRLSVVLEKEGRFTLVVKGAPEGILAGSTSYEEGGERRPLDDAARARCVETFRALGEQGYRVLAVASKELPSGSALTAADERELTLAGFLSFADPPVPGVAASLAALRRDGVAVKILTGDNELVTRHLCEQVGLDASRIVLGSELERMDDSALAHVVERVDVYARVSPAQKSRILRALKAGGHVVGFLGDGINDAPSLHAADVGISVAGATDIARDASDIILLEHRLDVLHSGIVAGRRSFANVLKYLLMGTSSNFGNMFSMAAAALFLPFLPMLPLQILLNNFLYDFAQLTIPTDAVDPAALARPQRWNLKLVRDFMLLIGPVSSLFDLLTFYLLLELFDFGEVLFHTGWFVESLATQTLVLLVIRTAGRPWKELPSRPLVATTLLVACVGVALPFTSLAGPLGFAPLPASYFLFLVPATASYLTLVELVKRRVFARLGR